MVDSSGRTTQKPSATTAARTAFVDEKDVPAIVPDGISGYITKNPKDHPFYPTDESFEDGEDYRPAPELKAIAKQLIGTYDEFAFIRPPRHSVEIDVVWKRKGGKNKGKETLGTCQKASGLVGFYSGADFVITISVDHVRDRRLNNFQLEALIFHELCHIGYEEDKEGNMVYVAKGHDDEFFWQEARRYGPWNYQRAKSLEVWTQVPIGG